MAWISKNLYIVAIPISMVLSTISTASFARAQKAPTLISQAFEPPDRGATSTSAGGATRGGCTQQEAGLIPLMPKDQFGLTFNERPTFYWHVSKSNVKKAQFILLDDNENVVYETNLALPSEPGVFAFSLPPEVPGLKVDKQYQWFMEVNCDSQTNETFTFEGSVERTKPSLAVQIKLNKLEPKHRSKIYAGAGIWHDAINNVAQQRCTTPNDSTTRLYWNQLLSSVGLNQVVSESLHNACIAKR